MKFEWDEEKNQLNIRKDGLSFEQGREVFDGFIVSRIDDRFP